MHLVCCCSLPVWRRSSLKKGTPGYLIWPRPGRIWPKNNNTCKGPWVLHPYQVSSKSIKRFWRSWKCKLSNGRQTTDVGQRVITIGHWSLRLLCSKNRHIQWKTSHYVLWSVDRASSFLGSFMVDTGILSNNMGFPSHRGWVTFCDLTICNDNPLLIRLCTELDLLPNFQWFP